MMAMKRKWYWAIGIVVVTTAAVFGTTTLVMGTNDPLLTEEEVRQTVSAKYAGNIVSSELTHAKGKEQYKIILEEDANTYVLFVDGATGKIEQLQQEKKNNDNQPNDGENQERISKTDAEKIASTEGNGIVESIDYDEKRNVYNLIVVKENSQRIEVDIDGVNGDVIRSKEKPVETGGQISVEEAKQIALEELNGTVVDSELDEEDGLLVYEIEIETDSEEGTIVVNAFTGAIESVAIEGRDDDD
ncbi:hypothetical protein CHH59_13335 [Shouchella clausii]|uniref:PepSY domain-containing protein n=2 Tax=Shouchella clausii TaxID=79880 RepID=A0A268S3G9_SHOCL|nr:hypothetical protein CHH71_01385 [Shouchella clausii]PAF13616.1 hypothetical protein CHH59_13335 [Shouchella clausii]PAF26486.1 hypothetical protein CHH61_07660 [Shouchella clausii]